MDLPDPICQRYVVSQEQSRKNRKTKADPSRKFHNEGTRTSPTYLGHEDQVKSDDEESPALPVQLHPKGA